MAKITDKIEKRFKTELKKYQNVLAAAKVRDINESDTVTIIKDMLSDVFGYDKYSDITTEYAIKNSYCDLAVKVDNELQFLIEVKAIGLNLKDNHVKQAVDYGANQGIDWVILTNGITWKLFRLYFNKPIEHKLVFEMDLLEYDNKDSRVFDMIFTLSKEGMAKSAIDEYYQKKAALNRFTIAAIMQSEPIIKVIKKELKQIHKNIKVENQELCEIIRNDVIKRDIIEDERSAAVTKRINRTKKAQKKNNCVEISDTKQNQNTTSCSDQSLAESQESELIVENRNISPEHSVE